MIASLPPQVLHYRYRKQYGVNLGTWFSLETWLVPSLFAGIPNAKSEMDLHASKKLSPQEVGQRLNRHWENFINDGDWKWMKDHGINTVRLPIAYFHFCPAIAPHLMQGTEYEPYAEIYRPAADHIKRAIETAKKYDMGVLVDLHGCPGAQGDDGHTGLSNGKAGMWDGSRATFNQQRTIEILVELVKAVGGFENVVGIELMNEPKNSGRLAGFYDDATHAVRGCTSDPRIVSIPLYVGDSWDLNYYSEQFGGNSRCSPSNFLVVDHHLYRCFTPGDVLKSAKDHASLAKRGGGTHSWMSGMAQRANGNVIIGEWSCALHHTSFRSGDKRAQQADWGHSQLQMFNELCAGSFFWTLKKEGGKDAGWCLYSAIEEGVLPQNIAQLPPFGGTASKSRDEMDAFGQRECHNATQGHAGYWDSQGGQYEHWRFEEGFRTAWQDCLAFWHDGGYSKIGFKDNWCKLRMSQHCQARGQSQCVWEYEHGFKAALQAFENYIHS